MELYAVTRQGVYRHEVLGIFNTKDLAINRAKEVCAGEEDDYHNFHVYQFTLNQDVDDGLLVAFISRKYYGVYRNLTMEQCFLVEP